MRGRVLNNYRARKEDSIMAEEMSLAVFDPIKATLAEMEKKNEQLAFDYNTDDGVAAVRSWVARLRGYKGDIARAHQATKADALAFGRKVDAIKNELTTGVQKIINERMKPLDEIEAAKRAEAEAKIEAERVVAEKAETERLEDLRKREEEVARKENEQLAAEEAANAEQREAERMQRERHIAEEACKAAEDKAERERLAAIAAAEAEQDRLARIERKRIANTKHRNEVETAVFSVLVRMVTLSSQADTIIEAIKNGNIPHVTINY